MKLARCGFDDATPVTEAIHTVRSTQRPVAAIILAAGRGERMPGDLPKVAHRVADRAMVEWVVDAVREIGARPIVLVVGYGQEKIRTLYAATPEITFAEQPEQLGTAHAVECARDELASFSGDVFVLCGDGPLIRTQTLLAILDRHRGSGAAATLATSVIENPEGYGRIIRDSNDRFVAIVEEKNATPEQRAIREVNPSYYCFESRALFDTLSRLERNNVSGEYYITDLPAILMNEGRRIEVIEAVPPEEVLSINTPEQLREVEIILAQRLEACR